jgi:hypothetical protein
LELARVKRYRRESGAFEIDDVTGRDISGVGPVEQQDGVRQSGSGCTKTAIFDPGRAVADTTV